MYHRPFVLKSESNIWTVGYYILPSAMGLDSRELLFPVGNVITPSAIYSYTHELIGNRRALLLPSAITIIADGPSVIRYYPRKYGDF